MSFNEIGCNTAMQIRCKFLLDYDAGNDYLRLAQSRTCLWVSADPRIGEVIGKVPGTNPSSRSVGQPSERGHLEATTVRAFMVSAGLPNAGVTARGTPSLPEVRLGLPSNPRQTKPDVSLIGGGRPSSCRICVACPVLQRLAGGKYEIPFVYRIRPVKERKALRLGECNDH